jgi:hypothetical protein
VLGANGDACVLAVVLSLSCEEDGAKTSVLLERRSPVGGLFVLVRCS